MVAPEEVEVIYVFLDHTHLEIVSDDLPDYRVFRVEAIDEQLRVAESVGRLVPSVARLRRSLPRRCFKYACT